MELNQALQQLKECKEYVYNSLCDSGAPDGRLIRAVGRLHGCDATVLVEIVKYLIKYDAPQKPIQQGPEAMQKVQEPIEQVPAKTVPEKYLQSVDWSLAQTLLEDLQTQYCSPDIASQKAEQALSQIQDDIRSEHPTSDLDHLDHMDDESISGFVRQIYWTAFDQQMSIK